jgi:hypothetical protein
MVTSAWKTHSGDDGVKYCVQFDEVPWNLKKTLEDSMRGWSRNSYGWNIKGKNTHILIYSRLFKSEDDWTRWAQAFPLDVHEKRVWGDREKVVIHKKASA